MYEDVVTYDNFVQWLESKDQDEVVHTRSGPDSCAVATFISEITDKTAWVGITQWGMGYWGRYMHDGNRQPLPRKLIRVVALVDNDCRRELTAKAMMNILEKEGDVIAEL